MDILTRMPFFRRYHVVATLSGVLLIFCVSSLQAQSPQPSEEKSEPSSEETPGTTVIAKKIVSPAPLKPIDLGRFPEGWVQYTRDKQVPLNRIWRVTPADQKNEAVLICSGEPYGYLRTQKKYQDYEFSLEWRFPKDPNGNSGVLIHTDKEDKIWPNSIQVQLHGPSTGSIFPLGKAVSANNLQIRNQTLVLNQWNKLHIKSLQGRVTVSVNQRLLGEITGCNPTAGSISLQSEGAEIHFRRIQIRELSVEKTTTASQNSPQVIPPDDDDEDDNDS